MVEFLSPLSLQGTTIAAPPGGTTEFLRGDGTWQVPAGSGGSTYSAATWSTATPTLALSTANVWNITLSASITGITITPTAATVQTVTLYITQDATGSWAIPATAWSSVTWLAVTAPYINPVPTTGLTVITLQTWNAGTSWFGSAPGPALPLAVYNGGTGLNAAGTAGSLLTSTGTITAPAWQGLLTQVSPPVNNAASPYPAAPGTLIPVDASGGSVTVDLPGQPFGGALIDVKQINVASTYSTTVQAAAPDIINRGTGFASTGTYATSLPLSLLSQGALLSYSPPGNPYTATYTASANLQLSNTFSVSPFAVGEIVYLSGVVPGGFTANVSYYVLTESFTGTGPYTFTYTLSATAGGSAITASGSGTTHIIQSGIWTVVSDDLPLSQLDLRYAGLAGVTFTGYTAPCVVTLTDAAPVVITPSQGNDFRLLLTTAVGPTRQLQNPSGTYYDGQRILIHVTQPASGAAQLLTYGTSYLFATGLASPTLTTTNGYVDLLGFIYNNTLGKFMFAMFVNGYA
jgi:hypothetical protein